LVSEQNQISPGDGGGAKKFWLRNKLKNFFYGAKSYKLLVLGLKVTGPRLPLRPESRE